MLAAMRLLGSWRRSRRIVLALGSAAAIAVGAWGVRGVFVHRASAQPAPAAGTASAQTGPVTSAAASPSDYASRVVAYVYNNQPITRQELGDYLVARFGADKLGQLLNRKILDKACAERAIVVTGAEIDGTLAQNLKGLVMDQSTFIKTVLSKYKKSLYEWKEDVMRPRLQMMRLVQDRVVVTEEEIRKGYDTVYGEKVECRIIFWPPAQKGQAHEEYGKLRDSESAFAEKAKMQSRSDLAATGGKVNPIARNMMEKPVEEAVFRLRPGEVTTQIETPQGIVMLKCDKRIPADTTVNYDSVKVKLAADIHERKLKDEMAAAFLKLRDDARPQLLLTKANHPVAGTTPPANEVVAYLWGSTAVTREELGEYLIDRYGADKLEFLVNRRIIDAECKARNIAVSDEDVDRSLSDDLKMIGNIDKAHFEKDLLSRWGKTLYEWREDVIRPKLLLTKLSEGRVKVTEDELKQCFEAHYGEKLECRVILWPSDQIKYAKMEYGHLRDSEEDFARKARCQASSPLASNGGKVDAFGRHAFGDENVERAAFNLRPGEVSDLIGTPQGAVMIKLDRRIPPDTTKTLPMVRAEMEKEVFAKKLQLQMQVVFGELNAKATPRLLLKSANSREDLAAETRRLTSDLPPLNAPLPK